MAGGLHYESLADLPPQMRQQVAVKLAADRIVAGTVPAKSPPPDLVAGADAQPVSGKKSKYHNIKTEINGIKFDSKKEARRYLQLMAAMERGVISNLRLQVDFTLQEAYTTPEGQRINAIRYRADFTYKVRSAGYEYEGVLGCEDIEYWRSLYPGELVVEDVKSRATKTKEYELKRKMMADKGYIIREV